MSDTAKTTVATGRNAMAMTDEEIAAFLDAGRRAQVATHHADGSIHLVPMSYLLWDGQLGFWTDPTSQKVRNLRRDERLTALVEDGVEFQEFRAVQLRGRGELIDDADTSRRAGELLLARSRGELTDDLRAYAAMLADQRVLVVLHPERVVSWDHRKLLGVRPDEIGS